jgi:hypothetical protein
MGNLDGLAGVARMKSWSTYKTGMCLEAVWKALGSVPSIGPHAGRYGAAINAWNYGTKNHPNDLAGAPAGAPGYLTAGRNGFGHVFLFAGRGQIVSTDTPSGGRVGITTVEALCKAWGRTYLGYGLEFCGHDIVNTGATYGGTTPAGGGGGGAGKNLTSRSVADIQRALAARGIGIGASGADGVYGPATTAAVAELQKQSGIAIDGVYGPVTDSRLFPPAPAPAPAGGATLKVGSSGSAVTSLQAGLNRVFPSYSRLKVDGSFGPATKSVVQEFQRRAGITSDGVVGPVTWAKLHAFGV